MKYQMEVKIILKSTVEIEAGTELEAARMIESGDIDISSMSSYIGGENEEDCVGWVDHESWEVEIESVKRI